MNDDHDMYLIFSAVAFFVTLMLYQTASVTHDWQLCLLHPATQACQHHH